MFYFVPFSKLSHKRGKAAPGFFAVRGQRGGRAMGIGEGQQQEMSLAYIPGGQCGPPMN